MNIAQQETKAIIMEIMRLHFNKYIECHFDEVKDHQELLYKFFISQAKELSNIPLTP